MKILNKKGFSILEYAALAIVIVLALGAMHSNIQNVIFGMWRQAGQTFAWGRQFDAQQTVECDFDAQTNTWYNRNTGGACTPCNTSACNSAPTQ